jgi:prolyl oligopeptidase
VSDGSGAGARAYAALSFRPLDYPISRRDPVVDTYHGVRVEDPYRWLESPDSPDTAAWTDAQNGLTRRTLDGPLRQRLREQLARLYDYPRTSPPVRRGGRYFFTHNSGLQNQPVLYVKDELDAPARVVIDPNTLSRDGTVALTGWEPSDDGRLVAYALSTAGSDWQDVRVRDAGTGVDLDDHLRWAKFVTISWFRDCRGFFYTRFPDEGSYHPFVCAHRLGAPQYEDAVVFAASDDPEVVCEVDQSSDHRFLVITTFKGASENSAITVLEDGRVRWSTQGFGNAWHFVDAIGDDLLLRTNLEAPRGRLVAVGSGGRLRTLVPESEDSLIDALLVGGRLAAIYLHMASSRVRVFEADGREAADVPLPGLGSVNEVHAEAAHDELFLRFASFTSPPAVLRWMAGAKELSRFESQGHATASSDYDTAQVWYPSRDGTPISMFLVHRRGLVRDGERPVWLTAYGGFNISIVPDFDPAHFVWLDRGGVLAVPNLRGGGEYGEAWHEAGMRERKQNVFDDCIAALEWLIAENYTRPGRIVLEGGSNGGLLVSAVLTQRPDLPGAVICRVPVADMLRYHRFTIGRFWIPEYGCAEDARDFEALYAYSPLHRVRDDVRYPPVLITTAETDDRVDPGMARKLAARLQAAQGGPALIRIERRAGHGAGKPVAKMIDEDADIYAFALMALALEEK